MEHILNDKLIKPNDEIIFSIIGDTELLWKQTFSHLFENSSVFRHYSYTDRWQQLKKHGNDQIRK